MGGQELPGGSSVGAPSTQREPVAMLKERRVSNMKTDAGITNTSADPHFSTPVGKEDGAGRVHVSRARWEGWGPRLT